jgi:polyamine oxidase
VRNITYTDNGVTIQTSNSSHPCIEASYAIVTFSLGVLQNSTLETTTTTNNKLVTFNPPLPSWKRTAIHSMDMGTYTKIFLQFPADKVFWDRNTQFFLYADPHTRGYYPLWQSLDGPGFLPGSGILFVTVVQAQAATVEAQDDATTKAQVLAVLRDMFGKDNVPEPTAFLVPRWGSTEWARGSYSNWPPSLTLEMHQNLRANVGPVWFAGEHTHPEYFGFLQAAWFEGQRVAGDVAALVKAAKNASVEVHYDVLHGTTAPAEYSVKNGWEVSSFLTYGDV